jgi:indole-3-glycerol phosphate synthase
VNALTPILERARAEVARRRADRPLAQVQAAGQERRLAEASGTATVRSFAGALSAPGLSVIAEHKRRSPSAGTIREGVALEQVVGAYERAGAAALSVLTESESFGGSLEDLGRARATSALPILRKDFVVDPYQVSEAVAAGADAILLIVAALSPGELDVLYAEATELGLDVLVEVHDAAELGVARELGAAIIGINNRDLTTLRVDVGRTTELLADVPAGALVVAESGFRTRDELVALAGAGVDAALIGEALMRAADIEAACRQLTGVGVATPG